MVKKQEHPDYVLVAAVAALVFLGVVILASSSASLSLEMTGKTYYFMVRQLSFYILGIILLLVIYRLRLDLLKRWTPLILLINIVLAAAVFLPKVGLTLGGATRWLYFGGPFTFQPSEFLKLTFVLYLASFLATRTEKKRTAGFSKDGAGDFSQTFLVFIAVTSVIAAILVFQPDISTFLIIMAITLSIYFAAGTPLWHTALMVLAAGGILAGLIKAAPYRLQRWLVFLNPEIDPLGIGYQLKQSFIAVGSGGLFGLGLGLSRQKFGFLPQSITDSIFAVFSEETGFIGALTLTSFFLLFLWRAFRIAKGAPDKFLRLSALGIGLWIVGQAFFNIGAMIGVVPLTGIPLPFISYGGSHLLAEMAGTGVLLKISRRATLS